MKKLIYTSLFVVTFSFLSAQEKPAGKFSSFVFGDYFYNVTRESVIPSNAVLTGNKDFNGFQFRRIFFTYDNDISQTFAARFRVEADQSALSTNTRILTYIKDAFLRWKNIFSGSDLILGIQGPPAFEVSESFWGYRSLEKTIMDLRSIVSSRDFGVSLRGKLDADSKFNYWVMYANNSSHSPEFDKYKRYYAHINFKATPKLTITLYGDITDRAMINDTNSTSSPKATLSNNYITSALFIGYKESDKFTLGLEGFMQSLQNGNAAKVGTAYNYSNKNSLGFSVFGYYNLSDIYSLIGRFDYFDPNNSSDYKGDSRNYIILGFNYKADKNVHIIPNIQFETYEKLPNGTEIKTAVTARITFYYNFL